MATVKTTVHTSQGSLTLHRSDAIQEFRCDRCGKDKKSKNTAHWDTPDGMCKTICNGCYGNILSKER